MDRKLKRILSAILVACMLLTIVPFNATESFEDTGMTSSSLQENSELNAHEDSIPNEEVDAQENLESVSSSNELDTNNQNLEDMDSSEKLENSSIKQEEPSAEDTTFQETEDTLETNDSEETQAEEEIQDDLSTIEETVEELSIEDDNWDLSLNFYDSTIGNGKTKLTDINWNALTRPDERMIKVQINYRNTSCKKTYEPNELQIKIPILGKNVSSKYEEAIDADKYNSSSKTKEWSYQADENYIIFSNNNKIETNNTFEGSIQISYLLNADNVYNKSSQNLKAVMNDVIESNEINFQFESSEQEYSINIDTKKPESTNNLLEEYIWIKYKINDVFLGNGIRKVDCGNNKSYFETTLEDELILLDENKNEILPYESNKYKIYARLANASTQNVNAEFYIGYPLQKYDEKTIEQTFKYVGYYRDTRYVCLESNLKEYKDLASKTVKLNTSDFKFTYSGNFYGISHSAQSAQNKNSSLIQTKGDTFLWYTYHTAYYHGEKQTIRIGQDILMDNKDNTNEYRMLNDNEYYYSYIRIPQMDITKDKYDIALFVRDRGKGKDEFREYSKFKYSGGKTITFGEDEKIAEWYIEVYDLEEDYISKYSTSFDSHTIINSDKISGYGTIYSFNYIKAYINGQLVNEPELKNYATLLTQAKISDYDKDTYGHYIQRDYASIRYLPMYVPYSWDKRFSSYERNNENEEFIFETIFRAYYYGKTVKANNNYYSPSNKFTGYKLYDLLPYGIEVDNHEPVHKKTLDFENSSYTEVKDNILLFIRNDRLNKISKIKHGDTYFQTIDEYLNFMKEHMEINIVENWKDTGRTWIEIIFDFSDSPLNTMDIGEFDDIFLESVIIPLKITYDNFLDNGYTYKNTLYYIPLNMDDGVYWNGTEDSIDINSNDNTTELMQNSDASITIIDAISTHQSVTKQVKTDSNNFTSKEAKANYGSEYEYKLKVRTGQNEVTNLVIYDSIEEYVQNPKSKELDLIKAYGSNEHWNGEFLGVDTSYAESKGYKVKVYYSENAKAGNLFDDNSWKEYSETTDKTKVKSLAFEYLDSEGNKAILPPDTLTYITIKMKAPIDETIRSLSYNGFRTQWNAISDMGVIIDDITGINSNIVNVSLSKNGYKYISGVKRWENVDKLKYPQSITINLLRDGEIYKTTITNADKNWEYEFGFEPINRADGTEYEYSIEEINENEDFIPYYSNIDTQKYNALKLTKADDSKYTPEILFEKDNKIYFSERSENESIIIPTLNFYLKNGNFKIEAINIDENDIDYNNYMDMSDRGTIEAAMSIIFVDYDKIIETLGRGDEFLEFEYLQNRYGYHYSYCQKSLTPQKDFFNILNTNNLKNISGQKFWDDNNNKDGLRPEQITLNLLQDGEKYRTITVDSSNDWKYEFNDIPIFKPDLTEYEYSVQEETVDNYVDFYTRSEIYDETKCVEIKINKFSDKYNYLYTEDYLEIFFKKENVYYKAELHRGSNADFDIFYIPTTDFYIRVIPYNTESNSVKFKIGNEDIKFVDINEIEYFPQETTNEDTLYFGNPIISEGSIEEQNDFTSILEYDEITELSGKDCFEFQTSYNDKYKLWHYDIKSKTSATNYFNIINVQKEKTISGKKIWIDNNDERRLRPDIVTINLLQNGEIFKTTTTNSSKNWEYEFKNVPVYDHNKNEYIYSVEEQNKSEKYYAYYFVDENYLKYYLKEIIEPNLSDIRRLDDEIIEGREYIFNINNTVDDKGMHLISQIPSNNAFNIMNIIEYEEKFDIVFNKEIDWIDYENQNHDYIPVKICRIFNNGQEIPENVEISLSFFDTSNEYVTKLLTKSEISNWSMEDDCFIASWDIKLPNNTFIQINENGHMTAFKSARNITQVNIYKPFNMIYGLMTSVIIDETIDISGDNVSLGDKIKLDENNEYNFEIKIENVETGDVYYGVLNSNKTLTFKNIPIGKYIISEKSNSWFIPQGLCGNQWESPDIPEMMDLELFGLEQHPQNERYTIERLSDNSILLTVNKIEDSSLDWNFNGVISIAVENNPTNERYYDSKYDITNLFKETDPPDELLTVIWRDIDGRILDEKQRYKWEPVPEQTIDNPVEYDGRKFSHWMYYRDDYGNIEYTASYSNGIL